MRADAQERTERVRVPVPARRLRPTAAERDATLELERLEAEAGYARDRLALYHARVVTARPSSPVRLRELQRTSDAAAARLAHAKEHGSRP